jgi:hypothetical protein
MFSVMVEFYYQTYSSKTDRRPLKTSIFCLDVGGEDKNF